MIESRRILLFGFVIVLALSVLFLLVSVPSSSDFLLLVDSENGGSVQLGEDVLLRGQPIRTLDTVQVLHGPLKLRSRKQRFNIVLDPGSRVRFDRVFPDTPIVRFTVLDGSGTMAITHGRGSVRFRGDEVTVTRGVLRWENTGNRLLLTRSSSLKGDVPGETSNRYISVDTVPHTKKFLSGADSTLEKKQQWYVGSLLSGQVVKEAVIEHVNRTDHRPRDLRDVFGYWVRDRWGNVFLYLPRENGFDVVSGGDDQALLTADDRRWRGEWPTK